MISGQPNERPLINLFGDVLHGVTILVHKEVALVRAELREKVDEATSGAIALAGGGILAFAGILYGMLAATLGLAKILEPWLAALVVGGVVFIAGLIWLITGRNKLKAGHLQPNRTLETLQNDTSQAKARAGHERAI